MENSQTTEETKVTATPDTAAKGPSGTTIAIVAVAILAVLGGGYAYLSKTNDGTLPSFGSLVNEGDAVARVNSETISKAEYDQGVASMRATLEAQGADLSNPELTAQMEKQVLDSLIDAKLLHQTALKSNFGPSEEAVQTEYDALVTQIGGADALASQMATVGLTDAELRTDIAKQLAIRDYLLANVDASAITVSEEEIVAYYDGVSLPADQKPSLEEVRAQIEAQLRSQKEQALVAEHVQNLRATADIEILI